MLKSINFNKDNSKIKNGQMPKALSNPLTLSGFSKKSTQNFFGDRLKLRTYLVLFRSLSELLRFHSRMAASKPIF